MRKTYMVCGVIQELTNFSTADHQSRLEMRSTTFSETMSKLTSQPVLAPADSNTITVSSPRSTNKRPTILTHEIEDDVLYMY